MVWKPLNGRADGIYWHILQTYSAAEIAFDRMDRLLWRTDLIRKKSNQSSLCQFLANGANVFFKSGDKPQNLRAETLSGAIIDECRQQQKEIWSQVVMPMLGRYNGWCDFYSTPAGFDWFYDLYQMASLENPGNEWATFHAPSTEAWWWTPAQIAQAKASMTEAEFAQEILAEFRDLYRGKAYTFSDDNLREFSPFTRDRSIISPYLPIIVGLDFNVGHMRWVLGQQRTNQFYWFNEVAVDNTNTQACSRELVYRLKAFGDHFPGVIIVGDSSGNSRHTSASDSDYVILCQELDRARIRWENRTPDANPPVKERVNTVNSHLRDATGAVNMWIHPTNCPSLKRDLQRVSWKEGAQTILDQTTDPSLTHASDAMGYPVHALSPLQLGNTVGGLQVIYR